MYYNKNSILYLDGKWVKTSEAMVDLFSQTMHYGNGVFEGIRAYSGNAGPNIFKARDHFERLFYSAKTLHIKINHTVEELIVAAYGLLEKNDLKNAYLRPMVYMDANMKLHTNGQSHFVMAAWDWPPYLGKKAMKVMVSSFEKPNPRSIPVDAKITGNYTNSIIATNEAKYNGYDEAVLLDHMGYVAEGPGQNIFYAKNDILYTPPVGNILPGITRATIIEYAQELGYKVVEELFRPEDMRGADVAFFTGTATEIANIASIDDMKFTKDWKETIAFELLQMYRHRVTYGEYNDFTLV